MTLLRQVNISLYDIELVALGVVYEPARAATLRDPPEQDTATWDILHLANDPGKCDITKLVSYTNLEKIEELICETFRE